MANDGALASSGADTDFRALGIVCFNNTGAKENAEAANRPLLAKEEFVRRGSSIAEGEGLEGQKVVYLPSVFKREVKELLTLATFDQVGMSDAPNSSPQFARRPQQGRSFPGALGRRR